MRGGLWILNVFAVLWCAAGLWAAHQPLWPLVAPAAVSAAILIWASRRASGDAGPDNPNVGRLVGIWSAVEGVAMFLAANTLINLHRSELLLPVFAIIVGLHFLPLARGIPVRLYYLTGAGLIAVGIAGTQMPPSDAPLVVGGVAALVLWASAIGLATRSDA